MDESKISFDQDVTDIETIRRHFGVERMALMGYSYLGKIAVLYALEHPERVERIVQFGPVGPSFGTEYKPEYVFQDDPVDPEEAEKAADQITLQAKKTAQNEIEQAMEKMRDE